MCPPPFSNVIQNLCKYALCSSCPFWKCCKFFILFFYFLFNHSVVFQSSILSICCYQLLHFNFKLMMFSFCVVPSCNHDISAIGDLWLAKGGKTLLYLMKHVMFDNSGQHRDGVLSSYVTANCVLFLLTYRCPGQQHTWQWQDLILFIFQGGLCIFMLQHRCGILPSDKQ